MTLEAKDLIGKLLIKDAEKRYSASEACKHPWLTNPSIPLEKTFKEEIYNNIEQILETEKQKKVILSHIAYKLPDTSFEDMRKAF